MHATNTYHTTLSFWRNTNMCEMKKDSQITLYCERRKNKFIVQHVFQVIFLILERNSHL